jgi:hypothetical protein
VTPITRLLVDAHGGGDIMAVGARPRSRNGRDACATPGHRDGGGATARRPFVNQATSVSVSAQAVATSPTDSTIVRATDLAILEAVSERRSCEGALGPLLRARSR